MHYEVQKVEAKPSDMGLRLEWWGRASIHFLPAKGKSSPQIISWKGVESCRIRYSSVPMRSVSDVLYDTNKYCMYSTWVCDGYM